VSAVVSALISAVKAGITPRKDGEPFATRARGETWLACRLAGFGFVWDHAPDAYRPYCVYVMDREAHTRLAIEADHATVHLWLEDAAGEEVLDVQVRRTLKSVAREMYGVRSLHSLSLAKLIAVLRRAGDM